MKRASRKNSEDVYNIMYPYFNNSSIQPQCLIQPQSGIHALDAKDEGFVLEHMQLHNVLWVSV